MVSLVITYSVWNDQLKLGQIFIKLFVNVLLNYNRSERRKKRRARERERNLLLANVRNGLQANNPISFDSNFGRFVPFERARQRLSFLLFWLMYLLVTAKRDNCLTAKTTKERKRERVCNQKFWHLITNKRLNENETLGFVGMQATKSHMVMAFNKFIARTCAPPSSTVALFLDGCRKRMEYVWLEKIIWPKH